MSQNQNKIVLIGLFGAVSIVLGVLENFLPMPLLGVRLGLANIGVMLMLYLGGIRLAFVVLILKITLVPLLSGNLFFRLSLSVPAGIAAFVGMLVCFIFLKHCSAVSMGVIAAILHMLAQLYIINLFYIKGIFYTSLVGWFLLATTITGIITGIITLLTTDRIKKIGIIPQW